MTLRRTHAYTYIHMWVLYVNKNFCSFFVLLLIIIIIIIIIIIWLIDRLIRNLLLCQLFIVFSLLLFITLLSQLIIIIKLDQISITNSSSSNGCVISHFFFFFLYLSLSLYIYIIHSFFPFLGWCWLWWWWWSNDTIVRLINSKFTLFYYYYIINIIIAHSPAHQTNYNWSIIYIYIYCNDH